MGDELWSTRLDDRYACKVEQNLGDAFWGHITVTDEKSGEVILDDEVQVAFGAEFGPDAADVAFWRELCVEAVESRKERER